MLTALEMTAYCAPGDHYQRQCFREDAAPDGRYQVKVSGFKTCIGDCDCRTTSEGLCFRDPSDLGLELSDPVEFSATLDYPERGHREYGSLTGREGLGEFPRGITAVDGNNSFQWRR